jgi:hypothetical protein
MPLGFEPQPACNSPVTILSMDRLLAHLHGARVCAGKSPGFSQQLHTTATNLEQKVGTACACTITGHTSSRLRQGKQQLGGWTCSTAERSVEPGEPGRLKSWCSSIDRVEPARGHVVHKAVDRHVPVNNGRLSVGVARCIQTLRSAPQQPTAVYSGPGCRQCDLIQHCVLPLLSPTAQNNK